MYNGWFKVFPLSINCPSHVVYLLSSSLSSYLKFSCRYIINPTLELLDLPCGTHSYPFNWIRDVLAHTDNQCSWKQIALNIKLKVFSYSINDLNSSFCCINGQNVYTNNCKFSFAYLIIFQNHNMRNGS